MRRYDDPVDVPAGSPDVAPGEFLWRGRVYLVRDVLAHWVEVGAWWRLRDADGLPRPVRATGRTVWRVEAQPGRSAASGVYDLCYDASAQPTPWRLARAFD